MGAATFLTWKVAYSQILPLEVQDGIEMAQDARFYG
jgi:hypothetical protein